jgi:flagellin-like hook-associated protein FlgL
MTSSALGLDGSTPSGSSSTSSSNSGTVNNAISGQGTNSIMAIPAQSGASGIDLVIGSVTVTGIDISTGDATAAAAAITSAINDGNGSPGSGDGTAAHGVTATNALDGAGNINLSFAGGATAADVAAFVSGSGSSSNSGSPSSETITTPQKVGSEFQFNTYTTGDQYGSSIAVLSDGRFVISWTSDQQDGDSGGSFAQMYSAEGNLIGTEFQLNTTTNDYQIFPILTPLDSGGFLAVWRDKGSDGDWWGTFAQIFDASGVKVGSEFQVNTHTTGNQFNHSAATLLNGNVVVTWWDSSLDGNEYGIFGQLFTPEGSKIGSHFQANTYTNHQQANGEVIALSSGGFFVLWDSFGQDGSLQGVYGQFYNSDGSKEDTEFQINTSTSEGQLAPEAAELSNGSIIVVWEDRSELDGSAKGIFGQILNSYGTKIGDEFQINDYTCGDQSVPFVTALSEGGFVVGWTSYAQDGDGDGIFAKKYDATGGMLGSEFQVNTTSNGAQRFPNSVAQSIKEIAGGRFLITWTSDSQDGDGNGVFGQMFSSDTLSAASVAGSNTCEQTLDSQTDTSSSSGSSSGSSSSPTGSSGSAISSSSGPTLDSPSHSMAAITAVDKAIQTVNIQRSQLGAVSNRLTHTVSNLTNISANLSAAQGNIEDTDFAKETTNLAKNQILQQASTAMLAQANASKQNVLSLLQG